MFDEMVVVQSAVSAFNNAALWAPGFLWTAFLTLPLFAVVWMFGKDIAVRFGWNAETLLGRASMWTAALIFGWGVLFGGNYGVLRDSVSVLPMMNAGIVFLSSLFVSSHLHNYPIGRGWKKILLLAVLALIVAGADMRVWWWGFLQVGAFFLGAVLGWFARGQMRPVLGTVLIVLMVMCAILMQPEVYRFGQLGNLTIVHLVAMLLLGGVAVASAVLVNVNARGRVNRVVFFKLKWLLRVVCVLGGALFVLTEAVPVLIATLIVFGLMFALSVWHAKSINTAILDKMFAVMLMLLGLVTVMPTIIAIGIIYWTNTPMVRFWSEIRALL